jgi:peptidoglycan/LPS O-acetylase OafA/YrhL
VRQPQCPEGGPVFGSTPLRGQLTDPNTPLTYLVALISERARVRHDLESDIMCLMSDEGGATGSAATPGVVRSAVRSPGSDRQLTASDGQLPPSKAAVSPAPPKAFSLGNRPALTGVRALLMVPVVVYHAGLTRLQGAWMPLEIFFVLSGFLITTMLATEHQRTGQVSLGKFYSRRAVRLLPPLVMTVVLLALYASFVYVGGASQRVWGDSAAALFYSDYRQAFEHDPLYSGFLTQCWSLAVEEQFYLIWAGLLVAALKFGKRRIAYALASIGIVACVANRMNIVLAAPHWTLLVADRAYYAFDTRADALFFGCLLGLIATGGHLENWSQRTKQTVSVVAFASAIVLIWILFAVSVGSRSLPLVWIPVSEIAAVVIITYFIIQPTGLGTKAIGVSFVVLVGDMTYAIYLVHYPVFIAVSPSTVGWSFWVIEVVRMAIVIPIVVASWYLIEKPLMQWRRNGLNPVRTTEQPTLR